MKTVNIHEATTQLSRLVEAACAGKPVVLARAGKPVARLVAIDKATKPRTPGALKGRIRIGAGWDQPLSAPELARWESQKLYPPIK